MSRKQTWARLAYKRVGAAKNTQDLKTSDYKTFCMKGPNLLQQAGVVQALAFLRSREGAGATYADDLAHVYGLNDNNAGKKLFEKAQKVPLPEYLMLSRDLLEISAWLRRFAQIELAGGE